MSEQFTEEQMAAYRAIMAANGSKGGIVAAQRMTPEQKAERARKGGLAKAARRRAHSI